MTILPATARAIMATSATIIDASTEDYLAWIIESAARSGNDFVFVPVKDSASKLLLETLGYVVELVPIDEEETEFDWRINWTGV